MEKLSKNEAELKNGYLLKKSMYSTNTNYVHRKLQGRYFECFVKYFLWTFYRINMSIFVIWLVQKNIE